VLLRVLHIIFMSQACHHLSLPLLLCFFAEVCITYDMPGFDNDSGVLMTLAQCPDKP
jgi:hypothetical protein